jgi:hypothetical protein
VATNRAEAEADVLMPGGCMFLRRGVWLGFFLGRGGGGAGAQNERSMGRRCCLQELITVATSRAEAEADLLTPGG